ncbi:MAG: hypothetical protein JO294_00700, partial [Alphaproteobacteria bacterium]|nr:hypothetical protein [Alphaproteobacteria bacterium]
MRALICSAALAIACTAPAFAGDEVLASRFGNTTITKDANGTENHLYYNADHTFTAKQGAATTKGTWKIDGNTICLTADPPIPNTPNPACALVSNHKVGETWTAGPYTVSLVAGIQ